jgi:hypothetical protein
MSSYEYNQLLKFLYFEGYADSYAEAEELLESMSDEEFEDLLERKYDKDEPLPGSGKTPSQKMYTKRAQHGARVLLGNPALGRNRRSDPESDSYRERASTIDTVKKAQDAGEEPRDNPAFKNTIAARRRPRASYEVPNERPGGLRAKNTKAGGYRTLTRKEELEMQESWYSGAGSYRTTASGRKVRRDEDEATDTAVSDMLQRRREAAAKKAKQEKLKSQGLKRKDGTPVFEEVIEYLFVEGYADTIENAEVMAENISDNWVNDILNEKTIKATGEVADRRAHTTDPTVRPRRLKPMPDVIKYTESGFDRDASRRSPGARRRKEERRQGVGGFREEYEEIDEAKVDWHNRDKSNVQDRVGVLRDRNRRLQSDRPEIPSGRDQTDFRTKRHQDSRGKKGSVTEENYEIDEAAKDQSDKQIDQGVKKTYKAGNVLDNTHQGRSPGLNKLPRSERDAKVKRMRERLNARRDDLFKERGNREDAKREQLKKLLGL